MARRIAARVGRFISAHEFELGLGVVLSLIACVAFRFAHSLGAF